MAFASLRLNSVRVVVATDAQTATDAMRLAHDGGVEGGFLTPRESGMRFSAAFLNPGTEFIVAYADDEPVATMALIEDGPFGLPSDRAFIEEIDAYRAAGDSIFEAGALVIAEEWRRSAVHLGPMVVGAALRLNIGVGGQRRMIASIDPRRADRLSEGFGFAPVTEPRPYLGIPGILVATPWMTKLPAYYLDPAGSRGRGIVAERVLDPDPSSWLRVGREGTHWTSSPTFDDLIGESGVRERIAAQMRLLRGNRSLAPDRADDALTFL